MNNYTPGAFSAYEKDLISRINPTIPAIWGGWKLFQPLNNKIQLLDKNSNPIPNIPIKIYTSRFTLEVETGLIDTIPEYSGQTDTSGYFQLGSNILTANGEISGIIAFLIQSKIAGKNYYNWLNFTDVNYAYWNGQIDSAVYKIYPFPVNPTAQFTANPTSVCLEHATIPTVTFNFKAFDINGNLDYVKILYSRVNDGSGNWTQIGRNINCSGSSTCLLSKISWHPTSVAMGDYYVVINAYDDQGLWCSGNATGTSLKNLWGKQLSVSNLSDCASGSFGPDVRIVNLRNCTPASGDTRPPIP
ncbi:MAG: hypothetical protein ACD_58C00300G0001 [uncultured bacterium]|nr:MAG: hypothetical protein ACD_58C00300G0001 [uncultured bacterium]